MVSMLYVLALGGNAITDQASVDKVAKEAIFQYFKGNRIVITHGNGPQVGELAEEQDQSLSVLTAETQAWIGTVIKERLNAQLTRLRKGPSGIVEVVLTEVIVDSKDKAFGNPTKPIGRFLSAKQAAIASRQGIAVKKLIGGYRRVVPSPTPKRIVQIRQIGDLLKENRIVIACGGGGMPVSDSSGKLKYLEAVIDKDKASSLLAIGLKADRFFILTNVDGAYLNYKKRGEKLISKASARQVREYLKEGQFEEGSMKPKVESCADFAESTHKSAGIGNLGNPRGVLSLRKLTLITPD